MNNNFTHLETENKIQAQLDIFLKNIIKDAGRHSRWLNTLAFMEHIGCRKIVKSQNSNKLSIQVLQHISEEARHACYFKNFALKVSPQTGATFEESSLLKGKVSETYFQNIDHKAEKALHHSQKKAILNYLYTTWLIEERALKLYKQYNQILISNSFPFNLNLILREEGHHLKTTISAIQQADPNYLSHAKNLFQYEAQEFLLLLNQWQSA